MDSTNISKKIRQIWLNRELCDYEIKAEGQAFHVHKVIIAAASDYFHAMLTNGMAESTSSFVEVKGISARGLLLLIDHIYGGDLELTEGNVLDILNTASYLQVESAIQACSKYLCSSRIDFDNIIAVSQVAESCYLKEVMEKVDHFIVENFESFIHKRLHIELSKERLISCISQEISGVSEHELLYVVCEWLQHDLPNRSMYSTEVLPCVRFLFLEPEEVKQVLSQGPIGSLDISVDSLLKEARRYVSLQPHEKLPMTLPQTIVRNKPTVVAFSKGGLEEDTGLIWKSTCGFYMLHDNNWLSIGEPKSQIVGASVTVFNNFLLVCGGFKKDGVTAQCFMFDPRLCQWSRIADMSHARCRFPLVAAKGAMYAFGGEKSRLNDFQSVQIVNSIEKYIPEKNEWVECGSFSRRDHAGCFFDGKIYLAGGNGDSHTEKYACCYDPDANTWKDLAPMHDPHYEHVMFAGSDHIYVLEPAARIMESYNVILDQWTFFNFEMSSDVSQLYACAVLLCNEIFLIGAKTFSDMDSDDSDYYTDSNAYTGPLRCGKFNPHRKEWHEICSYPDVITPLCSTLAIPQDVINRAKLKMKKAP